MGYVESLLGNNEEIVFRTRKHWTVLMGSLLTNLFAAILIAVTAMLLTVLAAFLGPLAALPLLLLIFPAIAFLRTFPDWWNEEYMVTNRRVVQAEGVINKHVIDSSLEKVNDVVLTQSFLGRLLNYGDIEILTASELGINKLDKLASPVKFKTEMLNQKERMGMDEGRISLSPERTQDIPDIIAELDDLRQKGVLTEAEFQQKKAQLLAKM